jgi:hypothetical protein
VVSGTKAKLKPRKGKDKMPSITESEYRGEWDANTLAEAEQIKSNPQRLAAAQSAAKRLVDKENAEAKAMQKVASGGTKGYPEPSQRGNRRPRRTSNKAITKNQMPVDSSGFNVFRNISK